MNKIKEHWEQVFLSKSPQEVSWTQTYPTTSIKFIQSFNLPKNSAIIDVGGGDSMLVDALLAEGYSDITVLDISEKAILRAKKRLGDKSEKIHWIVSDVNDFKPQRSYVLWHDRASFHFLIQKEDILGYIETINASVSKALVIGTFSEEGPEKCSGLPITQYSCEGMADCFKEKFVTQECIMEDHKTPFDTLQNFTFSSLLKKERL